MTDFRLPAIGEEGWGDEVIDSFTNLDERVADLEADGGGVDLPLSQTDTHANADTDSSELALHHTLGTGATQAAKGNHPHTLGSLSDVNTSGTDGQVVTKSGTGFILSTVSGGGGSVDHGSLTGLADDDHTQYHNDTRGDVRYYQKTAIDSALADKSDTTHSHSTDDVSSGVLGLAQAPAGSVIVNQYNGVAYPTRPTARTDIIVAWRGPVAPSIGGAGAVAGVDVNWLTP